MLLRGQQSFCTDKTVNNFFYDDDELSLRGWDKGCHGEVKRFADIKTPLLPNHCRELAAPTSSSKKLHDKERLEEILACEHRLKPWLLPAACFLGDPSQTPWDPCLEGSPPSRTAEMAERCTEQADAGQAGNKTAERSK